MVGVGMGDVSQHSCYLLLPSSLSQDLMTSINSRSITLYLQVGKVGWGQPADVLVQHGFANLSGLLVGAAERLRSAGQPREGTACGVFSGAFSHCNSGFPGRMFERPQWKRQGFL